MTQKEIKTTITEVIEFLDAYGFKRNANLYTCYVFDGVRLVVNVCNDAVIISCYATLVDGNIAQISRRVPLLRLFYNVAPTLRREFKDLVSSHVDFMFTPQIPTDA